MTCHDLLAGNKMRLITSGGLKPNCDGDGLHPSSDGLQPESDGLQEKKLANPATFLQPSSSVVAHRWIDESCGVLDAHWPI